MLPRLLSLFIALNLLTSCALGPDPDPLTTLSDPIQSQRRHFAAIDTLRAGQSLDEASIQTLQNVITKPGYNLATREAALNLLAERDLETAKLTLRRHLPQTKDWGFITRMSEIIADRNWVDLSPALVSSWARPSIYVPDDLKRPEHLALIRLHGPENVTDVVYALFMESKGPGQQGLRTRCWDLLHRLGQRQRLIDLIASSEVGEDDAMLIDLRAGAKELGLVPLNREEVLWMRKLREPSRAEFWSRTAQAVQTLSPQRRAELEIRDLPIVVSAWLHDRELLEMDRNQLFARVDGALRGRPRHLQTSNYDNFTGGSQQRLGEYKDILTWGDLAAMMIAIRALEVPQVVDHLFDYAERDRLDEGTEYGGVIALDGKDRFEVREYPPAFRDHDRKFIASQAMLDDAYTSIFHFHFHAQAHRNGDFAGPGFGDINYADSTRANCLVLTFINQHTMNVDYYRHGRVVVDLGEIKRP